MTQISYARMPLLFFSDLSKTMNKTMNALTSVLLLAAFIVQPKLAHATPAQVAPPPKRQAPVIVPSAPKINAKAFLLIDANSGKMLAENNSEKRLPPASLTKMMSLYVISKALDSGQIQLSDTVRISKTAWKTGGSRMFVKEGQEVKIEDLLKGVIVDSGNDACVALAEHLGGSEQGFVELMNQQAKALGMNHSNFTDSTGLPNKDLYTTAQDLAILARALVNDFPQYYHWYKQKWFTFNEIRQPNRNRLLWRDGSVDGIKTGHTNDAGYCLASSAKKNDMRLIAIVLGSPSEAQRADDSERLLKYGFRFYETHKLYNAKKPIAELPLYKGTMNKLAVGLKSDQYITIPSGQYQRLSIKTETTQYLQAPIKMHQEVGHLIISFNGEELSRHPLYALNKVEQAGIFSRAQDTVVLKFKGWFGGDS